MHMIVMNHEAFAQRLFKIHLEHCKRIHTRTSKSWSFNLWTEADLVAREGFSNHVYDSIDSEEAREDYLKLFLLKQEGGVVIDTSYVCLKDHSSFTSQSEFFVMQDTPLP